jgi:CHAT domain-containing protein
MRSRLWKICIGCILLAGLGIAARTFRGYWLLHSAETESNRLYANLRPFLYRWVGAPYGNSKGLDPANCTAVPESEILKLRLQTAEAEDILGVSGRSLHLRGRASLLTCQPEDSISQYQRAILTSPADASLHLELGIAFALNANAANPLEYEGALEHILKADQIKSSPESLYGSALLFQQAQLFLQARQRWADTAAAEPVAQWKEDSSQQLTAMQDFLSAHQQQVTVLSSPASYLAAGERQQQEGEEFALDMATRDWLADIGQSPDAQRAVQHLGDLILRDHHDQWLVDLLKIQSLPQAQGALAQLTKAVRLNLKGEYQHAAKAADSAEQFFQKVRNPAGQLRAELELIYSLHRRTDDDHCLSALEVSGDEAKPGHFEIEAHERKYIWIEAYAQLEHISCLTDKRGHEVIEIRKDAYTWINSTGYSGLALRSLGFTTEPYVAGDSRLMTWRRAQQGIRTFWSKPLPVIRVYAFYYTLANSAHNAGNLHAALTVLREGTLLMQGSDLNLLRGSLLSKLGQWELEAGLQEQADRTFTEMENEFKQVEPKEIAQVWDEAEVDHAEALTATGRAQEGLARLQRRTAGLTWPYSDLNPNLRRVLLPAFGNAYFRTGAPQDACKYFLRSITETEQGMTGIESHAQRDNALREIESSWRGLTAVNLSLKRPLEALAVWATFRSGRDPKKRQLVFPNCESAASPPSFVLPENRTALVYAFLPTGLAAWMIRDGKVEQKQLDRSNILESAERLSALVSDPDSSVDDISIVSAKLYQLLLAPFADSLPPSGTLIIDPDGELAAIPWSVLEEKRGHPLVERFATAQVIGILDLAIAGEDTRAGLDRALIFGPPVLSEKLAHNYPYPSDAGETAEYLHHLLPHSLLVVNDQANLQMLKDKGSQSALFHFSGHSISNGGFSALLLPHTRGSPPEEQYVTAEQIAELDLRNMKTVVLASCSSGRGEQSGTVNLDSMTRAFLEAGTQRVIAAGWDVNAARTYDLMTAFYDRLKGGQFPAEALRQAQMEVRQKKAHPYYWAGFQVFGQP